LIAQAMLDKISRHNLVCHHPLTLDTQSVVDTFGRGARLRCCAGHDAWIRETEVPRTRGCYANLSNEEPVMV
jgi:hypothetical protein